MTVTHRMSRTHPDYELWKGMRARCRNPNHARYVDYGGRGIRVCARWSDFSVFVQDMGPRPAGHSLDRIDSDLDYTPENCRWVADAVQRRNRRDNVWLTHDGKTMVVTDWAKELGVRPRVLFARLARGWSVGDTLTKPLRRTSRTATTGSL